MRAARRRVDRALARAAGDAPLVAGADRHRPVSRSRRRRRRAPFAAVCQPHRRAAGGGAARASTPRSRAKARVIVQSAPALRRRDRARRALPTSSPSATCATRRIRETLLRAARLLAADAATPRSRHVGAALDAALGRRGASDDGGVPVATAGSARSRTRRRAARSRRAQCSSTLSRMEGGANVIIEALRSARRCWRPGSTATSACSAPTTQAVSRSATTPRSAALIAPLRADAAFAAACAGNARRASRSCARRRAPRRASLFGRQRRGAADDALDRPIDASAD